MERKILIISLAFIFLLSLVIIPTASAQTTQSLVTDPQLGAYTSNGYIISPVVAADSQLNKDFKINFRVYNDQGKVVLVSDTSVNCSAFVFSPNENRIYRFDGNQAMTNISLTGRLAIVPASFMNKSGMYHWYIACEGNTVGGAMQGLTLITPTGDTLNSGEISIFVLTELFLLLLLFLTFYINSKISNARVEGDEGSKLFTVNSFRLVKPAIGFLSYIIFLVMTYAATSFVKLYDVSGALGFMDTFLTVAFIGMFAVLVMVGWKIITEALISKQIWRELSLTNA